MIFAHDDPEFADLLRATAARRDILVDLVEKDYWVTHTLWALQAMGLELWFKGGTSLSKGFELIERFSEDLDLKIEPGSLTVLPAVASWKSEGTRAVTERRAFFEQLARAIRIPGATVRLDADSADHSWRSAPIRVAYPAGQLGALAGVLRPFVLLEVGSARVTPFIARDLTSFVHAELAALDQLGAFVDNRPRAVRCVHPLVTLLEKLDALHRRVPNAAVEPATFVRHFEDAARIVEAAGRLPPLPGIGGVVALAEEMRAARQLAALPDAADPSLAFAEGARTDAIRAAYDAIAPMFWGPRVPLDEACARVRAWISETFGPTGGRTTTT